VRENFKGRLNLSAKASEALLFMVQQLKEENSHIQMSPSKLCSWVIENYVRDHFSADAKRIIEAHFNPKRYLIETLKQAKTENEIKTLFENALAHFDGKMLPAMPKKKKIKAVKEPVSSEAALDEKTNLTAES